MKISRFFRLTAAGILAAMLAGCGAPAQPTAAAEYLESIPEETEMTETIPETTYTPPDPVQQLLSSMTTEEKVGQLFLARCPGIRGAADAEEYHLGGYVLFGADFEGKTPDILRSRIQEYQDAARIPLLIAVDEEGGTVCRVSSNPAFRADIFPSPRTLYDRGGMEAVLEAEAEKAQMLCALGINVNLSPVCDIARTPGAFMYSRSLGQDPYITGQFVAGAISAMHDACVGAVMKHFPGYGENLDTHTGIAVDRRSLIELTDSDLLPFRAGMEAGGFAIMVSHNVIEAFDPEFPASLSPAVHFFLREAMDFQGVIITDDLCMGAIAQRYGTGEAAVLAVLAGNDLLCSTDYAVQYQAVLEAVRSGRISTELLDTAVMRILLWKQRLYLI